MNYIENGNWVYHPILTNLERINYYTKDDQNVTIYYIKTIQNLNLLNKNELIMYFNINGYKTHPNDRFGLSTKLCDMCGHVKHNMFAQLYNYNFYINVCEICQHKKYLKNYHINHRPGNSDTVIGLVEGKIDILINTDQLYYFYHHTFKSETFIYKNIFLEPWYLLDNDVECKYCGNDVKHYNSTCLQCLNFSYLATFKNVIIGWLVFKELMENDINCVIFTNLLNLLDYNIDIIDVLNINKIKNDYKNDYKNNDNDIENEELITEDNLHEYIKFDLNDDDEYEDDW